LNEGTPLHWHAVAPVLIVLGGTAVVLCAEAFLRPRSSVLGRRLSESWRVTFLGAVVVATLTVALLTAADQWRGGGYASLLSTQPMLRIDRLATFGACLVLAATLLTSAFSLTSLAERNRQTGAHFALLLISVVGMLIVQSATHLVSLFVGIELACLPLYALLGLENDRLPGVEGGLKAFLHGSVASVIILYGFVLLYGATGAMSYPGLRDALSGNAGPLATLGMGLAVVGFAAKVGWVPFHAWSPDAQQGASPGAAIQLGVALRCAMLIGLLRLVTDAFGVTEEGAVLPRVFWTLAALSMIVGAAMANLQKNLVRMHAYAGIAHLGLMSIGLATITRASFGALLFYLMSFTFTTLGSFAVIAALSRRGRGELRLEDLRGLAHRQPVLAGFMTLFCVSLAGFPGTAGFVSRLYVFSSAVDAGVIVLNLIALLCTLILGLLYVRVVATMYAGETGDGSPVSRVSSGEGLALAACAFAAVVFGLFPNAGDAGWLSWLRALDWTQASVAFLF
jgi:NADH-quinone oxidoreductase subunit N